MSPTEPEDPMNPKGQDLEPAGQELQPSPSHGSTNTGSSNPSHMITKLETRQEVERTQHHQQQRISEEEGEEEGEENPAGSNARRVTSSHSESQTIRHTASKTTEYEGSSRRGSAGGDDNNDNNDHGHEVRRVTSSRTIRNARARLGLRPAAPINEEEQVAERQGLRWSRVRVALREPFSEFFGVVAMTVLGNASVAQVLLSAGVGGQKEDAPGGDGYGKYQSINWGYVTT